MKTTIQKISPELAYEMLKQNTKNRKLKKNIVLDYANQMATGNWKLTDQGISISKDKIIINGQHRLAAIVKSKTTIEIPVTIDLDYNDVFKVYDTGVKRTASDALHISGVKNASLIAASIKKQIILGKKNITKITNTEIHDRYFSNSEVYQTISNLSTKYNNKLKLLSISLVGGIMSYLIIDKKHDLDTVESFLNQLYFNKEITNSTIELLRDKLIDDLIGNKRMTKKVRILNVIKTWNNYINGVENKRLSIDLNKDSTINFK